MDHQRDGVQKIERIKHSILTICGMLFLLAGAVLIWFVWAKNLFELVTVANISSIPTINIMLSVCVLLVALLALLGNWNDENKNRSGSELD